MTPSTRGQRWAVYGERFFLGLSAAAVAVAILTGVFIHFRLSGTDLAIVRIPYWGLAQWYILDAHVTLSFVGLVGAALWAGLRFRVRGLERSGLGWRPLASLVLGVVVALGVVRFVVNEHPILVPTFRATDYPSSAQPDFITLTYSGDPKTDMAVQWRTAPGQPEGQVRYRPAEAEGAPWQLVEARSELLHSDYMANDYEILWHSSRMEGLTPGTAYAYAVGHGESWSAERRFETAPATPEPFTFIYIGDSQEGLLDYGVLLETAMARHPEARFYLHAGDLVNRGCERDDWDLFFHASRNVFDRYPMLPTIGNHDDCDPSYLPYYSAFFQLPENGSDALPPGQTYSFTYGNAFFAALNSNLEIEEQAPWLDEQLAASDAPWKFVLWHHPAYVSKEHRDNAEVVEAWSPLLDKHGVSIAFQGHDHAYMRTKPIRDGEYMERLEEGVVYLVSVSGTKFYDQLERDYMEVAIPELPTYQVIDLDGEQLRYRAFDLDGNIVDQFELNR